MPRFQGLRAAKGTIRPNAALASALLSAIAAITTVLAAQTQPEDPLPESVPAGGVIGFVMSSWYFALYETPGGKEECPDGLQYSHIENYKAQFPTDADRTAFEHRFSYYTNRGPNGENVFYNPTTVQDLLPMREVHGKTAIGLNLDGKIGPNDFVSPEGEPGIDNQLYRVLGCIGGERSKGVIAENGNENLRTSAFNRILLEITGVHSLSDDDSVDVTIYRGLDPLILDSSRNAVPLTTQRIDTRRGARFVHHLKGKIVGGVLTTEPQDVLLPWEQQSGTLTERSFQQMRLRLKLTPNGASGLMGAYHDVEEWWLSFSKIWGSGEIADISGWSAPTVYAALHRYADARPDPQTGQNTAISAAYKVEFVRAFIVHPPSALQTKVAVR
jgi:hypothetical protein